MLNNMFTIHSKWNRSNSNSNKINFAPFRICSTPSGLVWWHTQLIPFIILSRSNELSVDRTNLFDKMTNVSLLAKVHAQMSPKCRMYTHYAVNNVSKLLCVSDEMSVLELQLQLFQQITKWSSKSNTYYAMVVSQVKHLQKWYFHAIRNISLLKICDQQVRFGSSTLACTLLVVRKKICFGVNFRTFCVKEKKNHLP